MGNAVIGAGIALLFVGLAVAAGVKMLLMGLEGVDETLLENAILCRDTSIGELLSSATLSALAMGLADGLVKNLTMLKMLLKLTIGKI